MLFVNAQFQSALFCPTNGNFSLPCLNKETTTIQGLQCQVRAFHQVGEVSVDEIHIFRETILRRYPECFLSVGRVDVPNKFSRISCCLEFNAL